MGQPQGVGAGGRRRCCRRSAAMLTSLSAQIEEMAVEATSTGDRRLIYQAIAHDPLTAAVLSLAEIQTMVDELFALNEDYLPAAFHKKQFAVVCEPVPSQQSRIIWGFRPPLCPSPRLRRKLSQTSGRGGIFWLAATLPHIHSYCLAPFSAANYPLT